MRIESNSDLLVSVTSDDPNFDGDNRIGDDPHVWFSTADKPSLVHRSGSVVETFVTLVNPSLDTTANVDVTFQVGDDECLDHMGTGETFRDALSSGGHGPEMVVIPSGSFRMGCLNDDGDCTVNESPVHTVRVPRFAVSKYEVTFEQWDACVDAGGCGGYSPIDFGWGRNDRPVVYVTWREAQSFVTWLAAQTGADYRLPSEAEWEYAARAGTTTKYHWGNEIGINRANCDGCGSQWDDRLTAPVASFDANICGLHDMHGNVWEWTEDCWNDGYDGAPSDGSAWASGRCDDRVLRGGSFADEPTRLRTASRVAITSAARGGHIGFRVARSLTP